MSLTTIPHKTGAANLPLHYGKASRFILYDYARMSLKKDVGIV